MHKVIKWENFPSVRASSQHQLRSDQLIALQRWH